jgi:hypothetical protein
VSDAIYPLDIDLANTFFRFHLLTWRDGDPDRAANFWNIIDINTEPGENLEGVITFASRADRRAFVAWWKAYTARFFATPPLVEFVPRIKPGRISGTFVRHDSGLDQLSYEWATVPMLQPTLARGLIEVLPAWAWIAANCRKPVHWMSGGWLFADPTEAAKFVLFGNTLKPSTEEPK